MIQIVEDEAIIADNVRHSLEKLGYGVTSIASSGEEAIKRAEDDLPDLVLMDIGLKGNMDGIEAGGVIRSRLNIPIIYVTAYSDPKTLDRAKVTDPFGYIIKPFETRELHTIIEIALYKHKTEEELRRHREHLEEMVKERTKELEALKEFNEMVVQSMEEGILIENDEGYIGFANPKMLDIFGISKGEFMGKHWTEIFTPDYQKKVEDVNTRTRQGERVRFEAALSLQDKNMPVMVSATPLMEGGAYVGNLKVFVDITERKEAEERLRRRAMKYEVEGGGSYLIEEAALHKGLDVLGDLIQAGYKGLIITRTPPEKFAGVIEEDLKVLWLSEKMKGKGALPPNLAITKKSIEDFLMRDRTVLLDRLDYLVSQNGFGEVLKFIQELTEVVYLTKGVLLVVVDPMTLSSQEVSLLEKELSKIKSKFSVDLDNDLEAILEFIKKKWDEGETPVRKDISEVFNITRPTAIKRLNELKHKGLIRDRKKGKFKILELTERGRDIL